jgi:hypothetical protein
VGGVSDSQIMNLKLIRQTFTDSSTIGSLFIDDVFECYTLEDTVRLPGIKIPGATAIPYGSYEVIIDYSNRFARNMPHVLNVPMFEGIRIHSGNTSADTEGCILLGTTKGPDIIYESKAAFAKFYPKLEEGLRQGEVRIEITNIDTPRTPDMG